MLQWHNASLSSPLRFKYGQLILQTFTLNLLFNDKAGENCPEYHIWHIGKTLPQLICRLVRNRFLPQHLQLCENGLVTLLVTCFLSQNTRSSYCNNLYFSDKICWKRAWKYLHKKKQLPVFWNVSQSCRLLPNFSHITRPTAAIRTSF